MEGFFRGTGFDWDEGNVRKNWLKHGVSREECEQVFANRPLLGGEDPAHSAEEARWNAMGRTDAGRRLFLVFTLRGDLLRVISARDMSRRERMEYEQAEAAEADPEVPDRG